VVEDGDIVNIDITAFLNGVHGDTNATFLAGNVDERPRLLVERTRRRCDRAIAAVKPGRRST
jgi:methionyl aminopeptidase